jgi:hypothetical protein
MAENPTKIDRKPNYLRFDDGKENFDASRIKGGFEVRFESRIRDAYFTISLPEANRFAEIISGKSRIGLLTALEVYILRHGTEYLPQLFDEHFERSYTWVSTRWD